MENLLCVFEKSQEEIISEQKLPHLASKVAIWDHFDIPQAHYLALDKMKSQKCSTNIIINYYMFISGMVRTIYFFSLDSGFFSVLDPGLFLDGA